MSLSSSAPEHNFWDRIVSFDRVVLTMLVVLAATFAYSIDLGVQTTLETFTSLIETSPFLLLSVTIAAYAMATSADNLIARVFMGRTVTMMFTAALFGALSPFCSCGVIPLIAALLAMGVPLAPVMAFWLASPITDPSMFVMTSAVLGFDYAIAKTVTAVALGLFGGFGILWLGRFSTFADPLREGVGDGGCGASNVRETKPVVWAFWTEPQRITKFRNEAVKTIWFLGRWLTLAFLLESLMVTFMPSEWISSIVGGEGLGPIGVATLVGVPAYLNGYAALPLVSGLVEQGMSPGAALSFMVAGGVTCIPAAIAVFALVKRPVFLAYVGFALVGSFVAGLIFQLVVQG